MDDVVLHQRLASGYIPLLSEHGTPAPGVLFGVAATSAVLINCTALRPAATAVGVVDIIIGGNGPSPVGIGGVLVASPPLVNVPAVATGQVVNQGRVIITPRSLIQAAAVPVAAGDPSINYSVEYGATLGAVPLYAGISNNQIVRVRFTSNFGQAAGVFVLADCDFDFSIERALNPASEP
jgi:hypothetical protein